MRRVALLAVAVVAPLAGVVIARTAASTGGQEQACHEIPHGTAARECYVELLSVDAAGEVPAMLTEVGRLLVDPAVGMHFSIECHEVLHDLGKKLDAEIGPLDMSASPDQSCATGFQHGIAEHRLGRLSDSELLAAGPTWCDGQSLPVCRHILGHVAMRRTLAVSNTPDPGYVVGVCSSEDATARPGDRSARLEEFRCLDGAYMEWALWAMRTDDSSVPRPPEQACIDLHATSKLLASACLSQVGALMLGQYPSSADALDACQRNVAEVSAAAARLCVFSVINSIVSLSEDPLAEAAVYCTGDIEADCHVGFARSIAANLGDESIEPSCTAMAREKSRACIEAANGPYPFEY